MNSLLPFDAVKRKMPQEVDAITKLYDYLLWMIPKLEKFPRSQKFILADRIEGLALDILDLLIEAAYSRKKDDLLDIVSRKSRCSATL